MRSAPHIKLVKSDQREEHTRNNRVRPVNEQDWSNRRTAKLKESVRFAANAKAVRTFMRVTQEEVGKVYGVSGAAVAHWESGYYFGWDNEEITRYCQIVRRIAGNRN